MRTLAELTDLMYTTMDKHRDHMDTKPELWKLKIEDIKELGVCYGHGKVIVLNKWMVENSPIDQVIDTLMHEIAHAIVDLEFSPTGRVMIHGKEWKKWARRLGAAPRATVPLSKLGEGAVEKFSKPRRPYKYHIVYIDKIHNPTKVEVVSSCKKKLLNLGERGMRGRPETTDRLWHITVEDYDRLKNSGDLKTLATKCFR